VKELSRPVDGLGDGAKHVGVESGRLPRRTSECHAFGLGPIEPGRRNEQTRAPTSPSSAMRSPGRANRRRAPDRKARGRDRHDRASRRSCEKLRVGRTLSGSLMTATWRCAAAEPRERAARSSCATCRARTRGNSQISSTDHPWSAASARARVHPRAVRCSIGRRSKRSSAQ
jgi:hypothetical protein